MDRERMQKSETEQAKDVPFSSSMTEDNMPSNDPYANNGANDDRDDMGKERTTYKNCGVETPVSTGYPLPVDPHAPPGPQDLSTTPKNPEAADEISDFGINERVDVGHNASINQYGLKD